MQEYYTTKEAAALLKVTYRTILNYIESGKLEATKTAAGQWRISTKALLLFLGEPETVHLQNEKTALVAREYVFEQEAEKLFNR